MGSNLIPPHFPSGINNLGSVPPQMGCIGLNRFLASSMILYVDFLPQRTQRTQRMEILCFTSMRSLCSLRLIFLIIGVGVSFYISKIMKPHAPQAGRRLGSPVLLDNFISSVFAFPTSPTKLRYR